MTQVNLYTCDTIEDVKKWVVEKPAEIGANDSRRNHVDVIDYQVKLLMLGSDINRDHVDETAAKNDGIEIVHNTSLLLGETSVLGLDSSCFTISVHDHETDAYPIFRDVFSQFGLNTTKDGNSLLLNGIKLFAVGSTITHGWLTAGQLRQPTFDASQYVTLPPESQKTVAHASCPTTYDEVGTLNQFTPDDFTPTAEHVKEALEAVLNDKQNQI